MSKSRGPLSPRLARDDGGLGTDEGSSSRGVQRRSGILTSGDISPGPPRQPRSSSSQGVRPIGIRGARARQGSRGKEGPESGGREARRRAPVAGVEEVLGREGRRKHGEPAR